PGSVSQRPAGPQPPHNRAPEIRRRGARTRRADARLRRVPYGFVGAPRRIRRRADREVAVEIAVVAVEGRTGIDDEDVAPLDAAISRTHDDVVVAARPSPPDGVGGG